MKRIGILSDTHGHWDEKLERFFEPCDAIWHAGDIGSLQVAHTIEQSKPLVAVHGNIDDYRIRVQYPAMQIFICEGVKVLMTHIGGYPKKYAPGIEALIAREKPDLFICGHSHILKIIYDKHFELLHVNPGAAGLYGSHAVRTAVRFTIEGTQMRGMEILEISRHKRSKP